MYLAELHGKLSGHNENKEDILTSNVFSFFKYAPRQVFLLPLLKVLKLRVNAQNAQEAEFIFWPSYSDGTQPDLVLLVGDYYLLVEAKYYSGFGQETPTIKSQLVREIVNGRLEAASLGKNFLLLMVTAHYYEDPEITRDVPEEYRKDLKWINWQRIAFILYTILEAEPEISNETRMFAEDLYQLFLKKRLRNFEGVSALDKLERLSPAGEYVFFNAATASFRGDFLGFQEVLKHLPKNPQAAQTLFFKPGRSYFESLPGLDQDFQISPPALFFQRSNR